MIKKLALTVFAVVATVALASAQMWFPFPIVGGPSFCSSTVQSTCVNTVPAGPLLTGTETIPMDTNLPGGAAPQTVKASLMSLGVGPTDLEVPLNGANLPISATTRQLIIKPAGTLAALSVSLPIAALLTDNQRLGICTTQIITSFTVTAGTGTTVSTPPTALLVPVTTGGASCVAWVYRVADTTWYRVQ